MVETKDGDVTRVLDALSSKYWCFTFEDPLSCPATLLSALTMNLPHLPACSWPERFSYGGVYLNGRAALSDVSLSAPCKIEYYEPKFEIAKAQDFFPAFLAHHIIYEDEDLIAVFKPAGLPCLPCREQRLFNLKSALQRHIATSDPGSKIHLPSRLDTAASGLITAGKSPRMHRLLQQAFERHQAKKTYLLAVKGAFPEDSVSVNETIGRDPRHPVLRKVNGEGALKASTIFKRLHHGAPGISIVSANPVTGRTHQIRVHAAYLGFPIVGDPFYGGDVCSQLHLLSSQLEFLDDKTGNTRCFRLPKDLFPDWLKGIPGLTL